MKIRCVLCHPTDFLESEERQIFLFKAAREVGHDSCVYAMCDNDVKVAESERASDESVRFFRVDDDGTPPHDTISTTLINRLEQDSPDLVIIKGVDYAMAAAIRAVFPPERIGIIVGGTYEHPIINACKLVFFETRFQMSQCPATVKGVVLPKFIHWDDVPVFQEHREIDIVNVGNFDEPRKAQELLLPFTHRFRVLFIGAGARLESFKTFCAGRPEVEFSGYLLRAQVFQNVARCRLMVHCSTWDGYPRAVAEALACGVPVVAQRGVVDPIEGEQIIQSFSLEELYTEAFSLLRDHAKLLELGRRARNYMMEHSSYDNLRNTFLHAIHEE